MDGQFFMVPLNVSVMVCQAMEDKETQIVSHHILNS